MTVACEDFSADEATSVDVSTRLADDPALLEDPVTAIVALYRAHAAAAYATAWRVTRDRELAAEAVQDAFLCLWRGQTTYQPDRGEIGIFLRTVVHRRAVDAVRREVRQIKATPLNLCLSDSAAVQSGPEDLVCQGEVSRRVRQALARLPVTQREPLVLAFFCGYTQTQIAARLGLPLGTVKTRIMAGKRELRILLASGPATIRQARLVGAARA